MAKQVKQVKQTDLCARRFKHIWDDVPVKETRTHILKQCTRCHGKTWLERRD